MSIKTGSAQVPVSHRLVDLAHADSEGQTIQVWQIVWAGLSCCLGLPAKRRFGADHSHDVLHFALIRFRDSKCPA